MSLSAGYYELRYYYNSRVKFPDYDPTYVCASAASDLSWENNTNSTYMSNSSTTTDPNAPRTDQVNVYLDKDSNGMPPTHQTAAAYGGQTLGGANLIDMCIYSGNFSWIERSVRIYVNTSGSYWLSFAADGTNDALGGAIADIRVCQGSCATTLRDNFPPSWTTSTNLFEDTFESPRYSYSTTGSNAYFNNSASNNIYSSQGTSGGSDGWPNLGANGWAAAPSNQTDYVMKSPIQGSQAIELNNGSGSTARKLISRPFFLVPGYYQVTYDYISDGQFSPLPTALNGVACGATPSDAGVASLSGAASSASRPTGKSATVDLTSNIVGVFMSHGAMASTPIVSGSVTSSAKYANPDGTTSTTPTVPPNGISLSNYVSSQVNPLLDICGYAAAWQARSANIRITKPGYYWLTASSLGVTTEKYGGAIDDVKLTALGSPYLSSPPSSYVAIPTPGPSPGSYTTNTGYEFVNDPLVPPAPAQ